MYGVKERGCFSHIFEVVDLEDVQSTKYTGEWYEYV